MSDVGYSAFTTTVSKTNRVLKDIEEAYGWPKERREQSYSALRSVLHALRDRLTIQEAADLAAQLPMLIRGLYYEGWSPSRVPVKMRSSQFLERVRRGLNFSLDGQAGVEHLVKTVMTALTRFVTPGELEDVKAIVPNDIVALLP
jgi:uncharacterized protein (DUF2267 family)